MRGVHRGEDGGCSGTSMSWMVAVGGYGMSGYGMIPALSLAGCGANVLFLVLRYDAVSSRRQDGESGCLPAVAVAGEVWCARWEMPGSKPE